MPGRCARLLLFSAAIALLSATTARAGHVRADAALDLRLSTSAAVSAERLASLFSDHAAAERSLASHTATAATPALLATPLGGLGELETELSGTHRIEQLLDAEPRRGPPPCIAETRIGGLELLGEARIGEDAGLTDSTQRGCGSSWLECASGFAFEVEGDHTYFVTGEDGGPAVWVHNAGFAKAFLGRSGARGLGKKAYSTIERVYASVAKSSNKRLGEYLSRRGVGGPGLNDELIRVLKGEVPGLQVGEMLRGNAIDAVMKDRILRLKQAKVLSNWIHVTPSGFGPDVFLSRTGAFRKNLDWFIDFSTPGQITNKLRKYGRRGEVWLSHR